MPNPLRKKNERVNELIRKSLASSPKVEIVHAGKTLIQPDDTISHHDLSDYLIPTDAGYRKIFEPIHELILQLFGENDIEKNF